VCPLYHSVKEDGGDWWVQLMWTYNAFEKGILAEPGGLDDQPMLYLFLMHTMAAAINAESSLAQERANKAANSKNTTQYSGISEDPPTQSIFQGTTKKEGPDYPVGLPPRKTLKRS
jgi:hypothetical protein